MHQHWTIQSYFPRRLGRPTLRPRRVTQPGGGLHPAYETWRESLASHDVVYELVPEDVVRRELLSDRGPATSGFTLITGEPGSGKSSLLEKLFYSWVKEKPAPRMGLTVPVLVRLRDLAPKDLALRDPSALADRLWRQQATLFPQSLAIGSIFFGRDIGRVWQPLWLLDGLDELPADQQSDDLFRRIASLPGRVCVTCRTAIAQSKSRELYDFLPNRNKLELLPLEDQEQREFLARHFEGDKERARALHQRVRANTQLRELMGSPLLLLLVAEVSETTPLPLGRAAFYREAVAELWERRVGVAEREALRPYRDKVLTELAASMMLDRIIAPMDALDRASVSAEIEKAVRPRIVQALTASGLTSGARENVEFLHLTLQEYYLARHLASSAFSDVLEEFWDKPKYEETLALLIALAVDEGRSDEIDRALLTFIDSHLERHKRDPSTLWQKGRSPLRLTLHLLARSGIEVEVPCLTWNRLASLVSDSSSSLRHALAKDPRCPAKMLISLAGDKDAWVRQGIAENSATPSEALAGLADDSDDWVRQGLAENSATPSEALDRLANDRDSIVRQNSAENPTTPANTLIRLARDEDPEVRKSIARNTAAPGKALTILASDRESTVCDSVAQNTTTPGEVLTQLTSHDEFSVRCHAAENAATPVEVLSQLANGPDEEMRACVARNTAAPAEILSSLAFDFDTVVRINVAENRASPDELLTRLASDPEVGVLMCIAKNAALPGETLALLASSFWPRVRGLVASNAATPADTLTRLASDQKALVRESVARNIATPAETLTRLASDQEFEVRKRVAENRTTPAEALKRLASDSDLRIRERVAGNSKTPGEILTRLASEDEFDTHKNVTRTSVVMGELLPRLETDNGSWIRHRVAANAATPADTLTRLASDDDAWVRLDVASNSSTPVETLTQLAADDDPEVRRYTAGNAATTADTLTQLASDQDPMVRSSVAGNSATPAKTLTRLASDQDPMVRDGLTRNAAATPEVFAHLLRRSPPSVCSSMARVEAVLLEDLCCPPKTTLRVAFKLLKRRTLGSWLR